MTLARAPESSPFVWNPDADRVANANVTRLMQRLGIATADELRAYSFAETGAFWDAVVEDLGIEFEVPYTQTFDSSKGKPWTEWFVGGRVNLAAMCVDRWAERHPDRSAVTWEANAASAAS